MDRKAAKLSSKNVYENSGARLGVFVVESAGITD